MNRPAARGFTLIEMTTSLAVVSIILLACGLATMMATRTVGDAAARTAAQLQAADAAGAVADDLNVAIDFTARTGKTVTFTVPDRLNAGSPQTVSYTWSGTPGDPLMRQFNNGPATVALPAVQSFSADAITRTIGPAPAAGEIELFNHASIVGSAKDFSVSDKTRCSQSFSPSVPFGTTSYTLTRIRMSLKVGPQDGLWTVSIRRPDAFGRPTSTVLAQTTVYGSALSTNYEWIDVPISGMSGNSPFQSLCVVVTSASAAGTTVGAVQYDQALLNALSNGTWSTTSNAGSAWSTSDWSTGIGTSCARMVVYGTVP